MAIQKSVFKKIPASFVILKFSSFILPNDYIRTLFFLYLVKKPRKFFHTVINSFYRIDHVYDVIEEFTRTYDGKFSILEFGVSAGNSFTKKLYATRFLKVADRVTVHGFDSFEGMHHTDHRSDKNVVSGDHWVEGQFKSSYQELDDYCRRKYDNHVLHKGMFHEVLTDEVLEQFRNEKPILIWIDCDYYTSAKAAMEKLIPIIPNGCVIYFDEPELNYGSRFSGEMRLIHEINHGEFGDNIELVLDRELSFNTCRVYRFINSDQDAAYEPYKMINKSDYTSSRTNDSPLP